MSVLECDIEKPVCLQGTIRTLARESQKVGSVFSYQAVLVGVG